MVTEYDWSLLSAMSDTNLLYTTEGTGATPPDVEKTRGEKVPLSTSLTLSS